MCGRRRRATVKARPDAGRGAATGAAGTALEVVLGQAMLETDPELRARRIAEIDTLVRARLGVVCVVGNDAGWTQARDF